MDNPAQVPGTPIAPSTGGGNKKIIKIAGIILGIVFLFVAAELVYYFYNTSNKSADTAPGEEQVSNTGVPFESGSVGDKANEIISRVADNASKGDFYNEATVRTVSEGKVTKSEAALVVQNGLTTAYTIEIQNKDGDNLRIRLTQVEKDKAKVRLTKPNGESESITLEEILVGDYVKVTTIDNLLDPLVNSALVTFEITRSQ